MEQPSLTFFQVTGTIHNIDSTLQGTYTTATAAPKTTQITRLTLKKRLE